MCVEHELPRELDRAVLEVLAEREVAEHLEEGQVVAVEADLVDVGCAEDLLHRRQERRRRLLAAEEERHQRLHPGRGEQRRAVVRSRDQRPRGPEGVAFRLEEGAVALAELGGRAHRFDSRGASRDGARRGTRWGLVVQGRREPAYQTDTWATEDTATQPPARLRRPRRRSANPPGQPGRGRLLSEARAANRQRRARRRGRRPAARLLLRALDGAVDVVVRLNEETPWRRPSNSPASAWIGAVTTVGDGTDRSGRSRHGLDGARRSSCRACRAGG